MLSKKALSASKAVTEKVYVEDVFSTYLYTGNGNAQSVPNGINLGSTMSIYARTFDSTAVNETLSVTQNNDWIVVYHLDTNGVGGTCTINGSSVTQSSTFIDAYGYAHRIFLQQVTTTSTTVVTNSPSLGFVSVYVFRGPTSITIGKDFTATTGNTVSTGTVSSSGFGIILLSDRDPDSTPIASANVTYEEAAVTYFQVRGWGKNGNGTSIPSTTLDYLQGGSNYQGAYIVLSATGAGTNSINQGTGKGGLVWLKRRDGIQSHGWFDSQRIQGLSDYLSSDLTTYPTNDNGGTMVFTNNGFVRSFESYFGGAGSGNNNLYASWTFAKQQKFFDIVTYTGNGANRTISHNLGSVPGCIIVKCTSSASNWQVYHRSLGATKYLVLNANTAEAIESSLWNNTTPTSTQFSLGTGSTVNANGETYVAYLFAHDAGGFGDSASDNVISCGSFTTDGSGNATVSLGYEPQWVLYKKIDGLGPWNILDTIRGWNVSASDFFLAAQSTAVEANAQGGNPTATGFVAGNADTLSTYIYMAIRRGPMRTPTSATSVFQPVVYTGTNVDNRLVNTTIAPDLIWARQRNSTTVAGMVVGDRMRGSVYLLTGSVNAQSSDADSLMTPTNGYGNSFSAMNGFGVGNDITSQLNSSTVSNNQVVEAFKRAPKFLDVVFYTGTGSATTIPHNLTVAPEFMIIKPVATANAWAIYFGDPTKNLSFGSGQEITASTLWNSTAPTSTVFTVGTGTTVNSANTNYIAYLFATCPGISKFGSYTGTGTTLQINCGFTSGARMVLIKRTNNTGGWYLWDSARGIVTGNDPYFQINTTSAEDTTTDYIDSYSQGFEISSTAPVAINGSGDSFIYLAIA